MGIYSWKAPLKGFVVTQQITSHPPCGNHSCYNGQGGTCSKHNKYSSINCYDHWGEAQILHRWKYVLCFVCMYYTQHCPLPTFNLTIYQTTLTTIHVGWKFNQLFLSFGKCYISLKLLVQSSISHLLKFNWLFLSFGKSYIFIVTSSTINLRSSLICSIIM